MTEEILDQAREIQNELRRLKGAAENIKDEMFDIEVDTKHCGVKYKPQISTRIAIKEIMLIAINAEINNLEKKFAKL